MATSGGMRTEVVSRTRPSTCSGTTNAFKSGLDGTLRSAYSQLFDEMGDGALDAPKGDLTNWFRASDKTSDLVGQRQASTFQVLAALAGHGDLPAARSAPPKGAAATPGSAARKTNTKQVTTRNQAEKPARHSDGSSRCDCSGRGDGGGKYTQGVTPTAPIEVTPP